MLPTYCALQVCGREIPPGPPCRPRRYCGRACRDADKVGRPLKPRVFLLCANGACGKTVEKQPSRAVKPAYCSPECGRAGAAKKLSAVGLALRAAPEYRAAQAERTRRTWADPEKRAIHEAAVRTPAYRRRRSEIASTNGARPEVSAAISASLRSSKKYKDGMRNRRAPAWPNWIEYGPYKFRSTWERDFARYLDSTGLVRWEYEPRKFLLPDGTTYLPDFRVETPFGACYVELHRLVDVRPGDAGKVAKLRACAAVGPARGWLDLPLHLFGEAEVREFRAALRALPRS